MTGLTNHNMFKAIKVLIAGLLGLSACSDGGSQLHTQNSGAQPGGAPLFWSFIAEAKSDANGSQDRFEKSLKRLLGKRSAEEIQQFDGWFNGLKDDAYRWDLWGAAYIINGGCGDDSFMDFRSWLISQGEAVFHSALTDPDSLADLELVIDPSVGGPVFETLAYAAAEVFEAKTGKALPFTDFSAPQEIQGEDWDEDDLPSRFPKLSAKYD